MSQTLNVPFFAQLASPTEDESQFLVASALISTVSKCPDLLLNQGGCEYPSWELGPNCFPKWSDTGFLTLLALAVTSQVWFWFWFLIKV